MVDVGSYNFCEYRGDCHVDATFVILGLCKYFVNKSFDLFCQAKKLDEAVFRIKKLNVVLCELQPKNVPDYFIHYHKIFIEKCGS